MMFDELVIIFSLILKKGEILLGSRKQYKKIKRGAWKVKQDVVSCVWGGVYRCDVETMEIISYSIRVIGVVKQNKTLSLIKDKKFDCVCL